MTSEPLIHGHVSDGLPADHPLAGVRVLCDRCEARLYSPSAGCLRTWVESGRGNHCVRCFLLSVGGLEPDAATGLAGVDCLPPDVGLER